MWFLRSTIIIFIILALSWFSQSSYGLYQPSIGPIFQSPLIPPPTVDVNITVSIIDKYSLTNVTLLYSVNNSPWVASGMKIIDGDYSNGTFLDSIPAQDLGSEIKYIVSVSDRLGYTVNSTIGRYMVRSDSIPPRVGSVIITPRPNIPKDWVTIEIPVRDDGTGVKNVTLYYTTSERSPFDYKKVDMRLSEGNIWNGIFSVQIPPQPNGTLVKHYFELFDNTGNPYRSRPYDYPEDLFYSFLLIDPSTEIYARIVSIDLQRLVANLSLYVSINLPSEQGRLSLNPVIENSWNGEIINQEYFPIQVIDRFRSQLDKLWIVSLLGNSNEYPFDSYFLNLTYTLPIAGVKLERLTVQTYNQDLKASWKISEEVKVVSSISEDDGVPQSIINMVIRFERQPWTILPIVLPLLMSLLVLGSTPLIESQKGELSNRLTVYLSLFIFGIGFFFSIGSYQPFSYGLTIATGLTLIMISATSFFMITSIVGNYFQRQIVMDIVAAVFVSVIILLVIVIGPYLKVITVPRFPWYLWIFTIVSIIWGVILKALHTRAKSSGSYRYKLER